MFKALKRLAQTQKEVVVSLEIEKFGLTITQDTDVIIQWQRGKAIDSTREIKLKVKKGTTGEQTVQMTVNHIFRKKSTLYFHNDVVQEKNCKFLVRAKTGDQQWVTLEHFMDFSEFGSD